jgi:2-polyprenyl-3-methyl-5-hydroxy-6-metoxy-1,4-benzoquinol methylase
VGTSRYDVDRSEMLQFVPDGVETVLDVGCDTGRFGVLLMESRSVSVSGVDPIQHDTEHTRAYESIWAGPYPAAVPPTSRFDCIVFNDVLEHMSDPWETLRATHDLLTGPAVIVGSVPNVRHVAIIRELLLRGDFRYREFGILDTTHLRFFTQRSLARLLEECEFRVETVTGINMPGRQRIPAPIRPFTGAFCNHFIARQIAFVARSRRQGSR